jgi:hypothetical protein
MLNEMRFGKLTPKSITRFKALEREVLYEDGLEPTVRSQPVGIGSVLLGMLSSRDLHPQELFPRRDDVDRANNSRLKSLHAEERIFVAHDGQKLSFVLAHLTCSLTDQGVKRRHDQGHRAEKQSPLAHGRP